MASKHNKAATRAFRDYAEWTPMTSIHKSKKDAVTASVLGVGGELNEYFDSLLDHHDERVEAEVVSNMQKELGDVLYYMGLLGTHLGLTDRVTIRNRNRLDFSQQWHREVFRLQELYKKMIRDSDGFLYGFEKEEDFVETYRSILDYLYEEVQLNSWDWKGILFDNQQKLLSRLERGKITGSGDNR
jgi:NTP pyrophosphatase (non-canonical NTP hydrolase)